MIYSPSGRKRPLADKYASFFGKGTIMSTDYADFSDFKRCYLTEIIFFL
jgi:hypothetical protein